jgi:hypothetical protein
MNGMVAGWIVSITLFIVCGVVAIALARIVAWLDHVSAASDDAGALARDTPHALTTANPEMLRSEVAPATDVASDDRPESGLQ